MEEKKEAEAIAVEVKEEEVKDNAHMSIKQDEIDEKVLIQKIKTASLHKGYTVGFILSILGLCFILPYCLALTGFFGVWMMACLASIFIGVQELRQDKVAGGVCLMIFGAMTLGIYPLVIAMKRRKSLKEQIKHHTEELNIDLEIASLQKGYQASFILSIIAIALAIILIGFYIALIAGIVVMIQEMRQGRLMSGVGYYFAITCTCGIVGIVMANKRRKAAYWE